MAGVPGSLPPTERPGVELLTPGLDLAVASVGGENSRWKVSVSVVLCLLN